MPQSKKEFMYVVNVQSLPGAEYALHLYKVWYKCKFPEHILSQEQLQPSPLELRLVRLSRDVIRLVEERLSTTVRDMQLLFLLDVHNSLKLVGTQKTVLKDTDNRARFSNFKLPAPPVLIQSRSQSSTHATNSYKPSARADEPPARRPASNLVLRARLKPKPRLPPVSRASPLSSQLFVAPRKTKAESETPVPIDHSVPSKKLLMVDEEAQACTWDSAESECRQGKSPMHRSQAEYSWASGFRLQSLEGEVSAHLQTVNSTISLPEPEPVPKVGAVRLGSLKKTRSRALARHLPQ